MRKWTTLVLALFLAGVIGIGIWYGMQKDNQTVYSADKSEIPLVQSEAGKESLSEGGNSVESQESEEAGELSQLPESNDWGIVLTAEDVSPEGITLVCTQSGGNPSGELLTGAWYELEVFLDGQWKPTPLYAEVCWEDIAWNIPREGVTQWQVNWTWLYGTLLPGDYRISKEIMDFRQSGDYDVCRSYAYFTID